MPESTGWTKARGMHDSHDLMLQRLSLIRFSFLTLLVLSVLAAMAAPRRSLGVESGHLPTAFFTELDKTWPDNRTITIVFHGHSVPAGYHRTPEVKPFESYPHLVIRGIMERHPTAVINGIVTAIGGENAVEGARRFAQDVLSLHPDLVFIDYALNDRPITLGEARAAWSEMVTAAAQANVPVLLLTPTGSADAKLDDPADPLNERAALIRTVAREQDVPLVDVFAAWKAALAAGVPQDDLLSQVNHPNLRGHTLVAEAILSYLDDEARRANGAKP